MRILPKNEQRRQRLFLVLVLVFGIGLSSLIVIFTIGEADKAFSFYLTPTQVSKGEAPLHRSYRVGGMVVPGSVKRQADGVTVQFQVTDYKNSTTVIYKGILPDMFTEKQAAIAEGKLNAKGIFIANKVLAKHDEKYVPPDVAKSLKKKGYPVPANATPASAKKGTTP